MIRSQPSRFAVLTPLLVVGTTLLAVLLTGYLVANSRQYVLAGLFVALPALLVALRAFEQMVLLVPVVALGVPLSLPTGSESRVSAVMLLVLMLGGVWVLAMLVQRRMLFLPSLLNAPLIGFALICCAAFVWSVAFRDPLLVRYNRFVLVQSAGLAAMVLSPVAALLIARCVRTPRHLWIIAAPFLVVGVLAIVAYAAGTELNRLNTRGLFPLWFVAIAYAVVIAQPKLHPLLRVVLLALLLVYMYMITIVNIAWLSGWVPALVAILAITLFHSRRGFVVLLVLLLLVGAAERDFLYDRIFTHSEAEGDFERLSMWQLNVELLQNHPLLGTGPAGYALYYVTYHPDDARSTHNNYLDIIAQTGILGSICWCWLVVVGVRESWVVLRHAPSGTWRTLGLAASGGLVGATAAMMLGDWVLPFVYNQGVEGYRYTVFSWIFLGVLTAIRQHVAPLELRKKGNNT